MKFKLDENLPQDLQMISCASGTRLIPFMAKDWSERMIHRSYKLPGHRAESL
jgi:hypothetical protein